MPVPYCIYSEISSESAVWESKGRCTRDTADIVSVQKVEIIEGAVCVDHVRLCLSIPPKMNVSQFAGYMKSSFI